jgi:protein SCO1/2
MLIAQLQRIEHALPADVRSGTRVLLVSLDPDRDTPERLTELARRHGVDESRWRFTRTSESGVREIAALLGVSYRRLPDGQISHSPLIALLDRDGVVVERLLDTLADPSELVTAVRALSQSRPGS